MFCTSCGNQIADMRKMKKKILVILLCLGTLIGLCGCGDEKNSAKKEQSTMEAYKECYNEFYSKHYLDDIDYLQYLYQSMGLEDASYLQYDEEYGGTYETVSEADCAGKIVYVNDEPLLAIANLVDCGESVYSDEEDTRFEFIYDVYFYKYDGKKVVEVTMIPQLVCEDDGFSLYTIDNKIYLDTYYHDMYVVEGETYKTISGNSESDEGVSNELGWIYNGNMVYCMINEGSNKYAINGELFTSWLDYLSEQEIINSLQLDIIYGKYLVAEGLSDMFEIVHWQDGVYYYYYDEVAMEAVNTDTDAEYEATTAITIDTETGEPIEDVVEESSIANETFIVFGYDEDCTDIVIPETVMGYQVSTIDFRTESDYFYFDEVVEMCYEEYTYIDLNIEIPDSVISISPVIFKAIYCNEGSYAQQYAEKIGIPYVIGTIETNKDDEPIYPEKYKISNTLNNYQKYINENYDTEYGEYRLIDINQDGIQEILYRENYESIALCDIDEDNNVVSMWFWGDIAIDSNGTIIDKGISMSVYNIPDTRLLVYNQETNTYDTTHVLSLKNTDNWTDFDWTDYDYSKIKEDTRLFTYYVDDVQYATYEEAINVFNSYYAYGTQIEIKNFYNSLEEAYENIGIDEIGFYIGDIEAMSYTDGVLSISDDYGVSISYSVADDCVWEFDSPFDDTLTPITYEEIERDWTEARNYYLEYGEMYWNYYEVTVVVKDNQVIRVYTSHN